MPGSRWGIRVLCAAWLLCEAAPARAVILFQVNSVDDPGDGVCDVSHCTLREAISAANASPNSGGADQILFSIPGSGPHRIVLASTLPTVSDAALIRGYTQPGSTENSLDQGSDAQIMIVLDARDVGTSFEPSLRLNAAGSEVSGIAFVNRSEVGALHLDPGSRVWGSWFGVEPNGHSLGANHDGIRILAGAPAPLVGGPSNAERNVLAATSNNAITMLNPGPALIQNNLFGLLPDGITPGLSFRGVFSSFAEPGQALIGNVFACSSQTSVVTFGALIEGNSFGLAADGVSVPTCVSRGLSLTSTTPALLRDNLIAHIAPRGVLIGNTARNISFSRNRMYNNASYHIDLGADGFNPNDPLDADDGPNRLQNHPLIHLAIRLPDGSVRIQGTLDSLPDTDFRIEFYAGNRFTRTTTTAGVLLGDAERIGLQTVDVRTDSTGHVSFGSLIVEFDRSGSIAVVFASATRLDAGGDPVESSEYGPARAAFDEGATEFVVSNTNSSGPGSLQQAFMEADSKPDDPGRRDRIVFAIPGPGPHVINSFTPVLSTAGAIEVDATTQPGSVPNSASTGHNAVLPIELSEINLVTTDSPDALIRGLLIRGATGTGLGMLELGPNSRAEGNWVGVNGAGTGIAGSVTGGALIRCRGCSLGGESVAQRNLIGANTTIAGLAAIEISGSAAQVLGNLVGLRSNGLTRLGIPVAAASLETASTGIRILGNNAVVRNNSIAGYQLGLRVNADDLQLTDNRIGVADNDTNAAGHSGPGLWLDSGIAARVERNHIGNNQAAGIVVSSAIEAALVDNRLRDNTGLAVDLGNDGISANDPGDGDSGPNALQNHPVLSEALRDDSGVQVHYVLDSLPDAAFRLRYCLLNAIDPSGHGECDSPADSLMQEITTNGAGLAAGASLQIPFAAGAIAVTASAARVTSGGEESSEFAASVPIRIATSTAIDSIETAVVALPFRVNVSTTALLAGNIATGSVEVLVSDGASQSSCSAPLDGGVGGCELSWPDAGNLQISASYAGNANFGASATSVSHAIGAAPTTTVITAHDPDPSTFGESVTVSYTISAAAITPIGLVEVSDGHGGQCTSDLSAGSGSCVLTPAAGGALALQASYTGASNFLPSSASVPHQVNAVASQLSILDHNPNPSVSGQLINIEAQLTSSVGNPVGPIVISDGAGASCQISGNVGTCSLIPFNAGTVILRADFDGDPTHLASTASSPQTVDRAASDVQAGIPFPPTQPSEPARQFAPLRFPVTIQILPPGAGVATGTISVQANDGSELCVIVLPASNCDLVPQTPGTRSFDLDYPGDGRFLPSTTSIVVDVLPDALFGNNFEEF